MKVHVPIFVQDFWTSKQLGTKTLEGFYIEDEPFFLDGPITRRVAVLDFDPDSGELLPGAQFQPPEKGRKTGRYLIADEKDFTAHDINQTCVYAAVYQALKMFREPDTLGRELDWAFDAPHLLVIPRAGRWMNAYYERDSHSLQFFYFEHPYQPGKMIYTSLSRDIVAHETGHAILDAIAPHLYDATTPQSLALHEAVADLVAILTAFRSPELRVNVLKRTNGSIECSTEFSAVAEEFGSALSDTGLAGYLRNLYNQKTLDPQDTSLDPAGKPNYVPQKEPHDLSEVLSGALYSVMFKLHNAKKKELARSQNKSEFAVSGEALALSALRFKRMVLRGLDYLAPGEVSFADYGRAILAADQASHPDSGAARKWLVDEFVRRKIVSIESDLKVDTNYEYPALKTLDLQDLVDSDWVAYKFAEENQDLLCIPRNVTFKVEPRLDVTKRTYHRNGPRDTRECLFKVSWTITEPNPLGSRFPARRRLTNGTTLAIDWATHKIRARLTSNKADRPTEAAEQRKARDEFLKMMTAEGILRPAAQSSGMDGKKLRTVVCFDETKGAMRVHSMANMLHLIERR
jgi:hypothetical protein